MRASLTSSPLAPDQDRPTMEQRPSIASPPTHLLPPECLVIARAASTGTHEAHPSRGLLTLSSTTCIRHPTPPPRFPRSLTPPRIPGRMSRRSRRWPPPRSFIHLASCSSRCHVIWLFGPAPTLIVRRLCQPSEVHSVLLGPGKNAHCGAS